MTPNLAAITGIGSVSPYGPLAGLIPPLRLGTRTYHRVANRRTAASISGQAISSRRVWCRA